jgi:hypothetical protein
VNRKATCLGVAFIYLLLGLGFAACFLLRFPTSPGYALPEASSRIKYALGGGFLAALPALFALSWLREAWLRVRERAQLARASEGGLPADGEWGVFYGPIHRDGPPLTAPLTRRDCLLYRYCVSHVEIEKSFGGHVLTNEQRSTTSSGENNIVDAEGFALTPSTVHTAGGPVKLLTQVTAEFTPTVLSFDEVVENYKAYAATTTLRSRDPRQDAEGVIRYDLGTGELNPKSARRMLIQEHVLQHGDNVVVFGKYSAARGGIVRDPHGPRETRLRKGSIDALKKGLALSAIGNVALAVFFCAVAAAGAWVFFAFGPTDIWN